MDIELNHLCLGCMEEKTEAIKCPHCGWLEGSAPESALHLPSGTVLQDKYLVGRALGQGGFGITYLAWDMNLNMKLAIKEYLPQELAYRTGGQNEVSIYKDSLTGNFNYGLEKFLEEARTLAQFNEHPNIVSVRDFFKANGSAYLVMNHIEGVTLKEYLASRDKPLPFDQALDVFMPVLDALKEVHAAGILHRDISPDNLLIDSNGRVVLIDFGAARQAMGDKSRSMSLIMKAGYSPEEQYRSQGKQGPWTDIYAVAATFYHSITGVMPPESLDRMAEDTLNPPSQLGIKIKPHFEQAVLKAMAVKAEERHKTIEEFQNNLFLPELKEELFQDNEPLRAESKTSERAEMHFTDAARDKKSSTKSKAIMKKTALILALIVVLISSVAVFITRIDWVAGSIPEELQTEQNEVKEEAADEPETANTESESLIVEQQDDLKVVPDQYSSIQEAIDAANDGDTVQVKAGRYNENIDFKGKNITLSSEDPGNPGVVEATVIKGLGNGPVVKFQSGEDINTVLKGFVITGGNSDHGGGIFVTENSSPTIESNIIENNEASLYGGGIYVIGSSPYIINNTIRNNISNENGGGLFLYSSDATIEDNILEANQAINGGGLAVFNDSSPAVNNNTIIDNYSEDGGGIIVANSSPDIVNNLISDNDGGGIRAAFSSSLIEGNQIKSNFTSGYGGGIYSYESDLYLKDNSFEDNRAQDGGAVFSTASNMTIENNVFKYNKSKNTGGGISLSDSDAIIEDNDIDNNESELSGGGIAVVSSSAEISNNKFTNNTTVKGGGGIFILRSTPEINGNIFNRNRAEEGGAIWSCPDSDVLWPVLFSNDFDGNIPDGVYHHSD